MTAAYIICRSYCFGNEEKVIYLVKSMKILLSAGVNITGVPPTAMEYLTPERHPTLKPVPDSLKSDLEEFLENNRIAGYPDIWEHEEDLELAQEIVEKFPGYPPIKTALRKHCKRIFPSHF
jgi:hypothetical protein